MTLVRLASFGLLTLFAACENLPASSLAPSVSVQPSDPRVEGEAPYDDSPVSPCSGACRETVASGLINPGALVAFGSQVAVVGNGDVSLVSKRGGAVKTLYQAKLLNTSLRYQAGQLYFVEFRNQALDHPEPRSISLTGGEPSWLFDDARWPFVPGPAVTLAPDRYTPFAFINGDGQFRTTLFEGTPGLVIQKRQSVADGWLPAANTPQDDASAPFFLTAIDDRHLYYVGTTNQMFALPTKGGAARQLTAAPVNARRLVRFDDTVAWLSVDSPQRGDYAVECVDLKSDAPAHALVALHSEHWPDALTVVGSWLVWKDSQGIARLPREGGTIERLIDAADVAELVVDGSWLYFTRNTNYAIHNVHGDAKGTVERVRWQP
ncbi:MAG: hypothetical protein K1X64_19825 [Myxococcaceae bacterium]|nr:hypothetical protein [Myxococcaceae bacterium]